MFLRKQQIWSHLLKKFLMEKIFCFFWSVILLSILICLSIWTMSKFEVCMIERILGYAYVIKCTLKLNILFISFKSSQANTRVFLPRRSRSNWLPKFYNPICNFLWSTSSWNKIGSLATYKKYFRHLLDQKS